MKNRKLWKLENHQKQSIREHKNLYVFIGGIGYAKCNVLYVGTTNIAVGFIKPHTRTMTVANLDLTSAGMFRGTYKNGNCLNSTITLWEA